MSQSYLFHIGGDGSLSEMTPQPYDNEDYIQRLLAEHPAILGGQYRDQEPRRWALIQREVPVPDGAVTAGRSLVAPSLDEWFSTYRQRHGVASEAIAGTIRVWAEVQGLELFITAAQTPSVGWSVLEGEARRYPLLLTGNGKVATSLAYLASSPKYAEEADRQQLVDALRATGLDLSLSSLNGDIRIPISALDDPGRRDRYLNELQRIIERIRA